jgi:hypothetical protein
MQQRGARKVAGLAQPSAAFHEPRAAHRKHLLGAQARDMQAGGRSVAVANGDVDVLAREVDMVQGRAHP